MKKTAYYLFLSTLFFSPIAFGTVETWSYLIMEVLICASALLLSFSPDSKKFYQVPGITPLILICGFIFLQIIPLPESLVRIISPATHNIYLNSSGLTGPIDWIPLSIYPRATLMTFVKVCTYSLFFIITIQFLSDGVLLRKTLSAIAWFSALLSLFVIIEFTTRSLNYRLPHDKLMWIRPLHHGGYSVGPYVNRNHYAGLMEMIFPLMLSLFLALRPALAEISFKKKIADFFNQKKTSLHLLYGTAAILAGTSIFLSLSRGGTISLSLSIMLFAFFLFVKEKQKKQGLLIAVVITTVLILTGSSGWDAIFKRFENIRSETGEIELKDGRFIVWHDSLKIIKDFPLFGTGAGTFVHAYPAYRTRPGNRLLEHAHNDYIEFLCTGGFIMTGLMMIFLTTVFMSALRSYRKRREKFSIYLFIGCITSVTAILIHSISDFNMQVGANGLYFFFILALAVSAANTRFRRGIPATYLQKSNIKPFITGVLAFFLFIGALFTGATALIANYYFADYKNIQVVSGMPENTLLQISDAAKKAAAYDFLNATYYQFAAKSAAVLKQNSTAMMYYADALRLNPTNSSLLADAAYFIYHQGNADMAKALFHTSIRQDKKNMAAYLKYAAMFFDQNRIEEGLNVLKNAMSVDTQAAGDCLYLMVLYNVDENKLIESLPDRVEPHLALGDFFDSLGEKQKAEAAYLKALEYLPNETQIKKSYFTHVYNFYRNLQSDEKALRIIQKAITYFPNDDHLRRIAGNLYNKLGINYRAEEEYLKSKILESQ